MTVHVSFKVDANVQKAIPRGSHLGPFRPSQTFDLSLNWWANSSDDRLFFCHSMFHLRDFVHFLSFQASSKFMNINEGLDRRIVPSPSSPLSPSSPFVPSSFLGARPARAQYFLIFPIPVIVSQLFSPSLLPTLFPPLLLLPPAPHFPLTLLIFPPSYSAPSLMNGFINVSLLKCWYIFCLL